jgi:hypothetical protein
MGGMENIENGAPTPETDSEKERRLLLENRKVLLAKIAQTAEKRWNLLEALADRYCNQLLDEAKLETNDLKGIGKKISDPDDRLLIFIKKINGGLVAWRGENPEMDKKLKQLNIENQKIILNKTSNFSKLPTPMGGLYEKLQNRLLGVMNDEERKDFDRQTEELQGLKRVLAETNRQITYKTDMEAQDPGI